MKKICLDLSQCKSLGDTIASTPVIRKLYNSYGQKITVITDYLEIFKRNDLVDKVYSYTCSHLCLHMSMIVFFPV